MLIAPWRLDSRGGAHAARQPMTLMAVQPLLRSKRVDLLKMWPRTGAPTLGCSLSLPLQPTLACSLSLLLQLL